MNSTVTFTYDSATCELPPPAPGRRDHVRRVQAAGVTAGGETLVADGATTRVIRTEIFRSLTTAQWTALSTFFSDTAQGMRRAFSYTDTSDETTTVRFADATLEAERVAPDVWDVTVRMEATS